MIFKKRENNKYIDNREKLKNVIKKTSNRDLLFIRHEIFLELKKRGVLNCSK